METEYHTFHNDAKASAAQLDASIHISQSNPHRNAFFPSFGSTSRDSFR